MVNPVSTGTYYSYLNQLQGGGTVPAPTTPTTPTTPATGSTAPASANDASAVSSLLGNGTSGFSSEILSLLQPDSSGKFDPISTLLGGASPNDALTSLYANLFASSTAAAFTQANANGATQAAVDTSTANTNPVQNLLDAATKASVAYNKTNLQNSQAVVQANSFQSDGVTPLVA